jgi:hypothetical protein
MFGDNDTSEDLHQSSSQIHQALDVYRKISDLLGHPEKIEQLPLTSDQRPHKKRLNSDPD